MFNRNEQVRYLDLFSGIGGFRLAMERVGKKIGLNTKCVGYSEIDKNAVLTYGTNFDVDSETGLGDITKFESKKTIEKSIPDFEVLFAGFPCQPFSLMGLKKGFTDARGTLFFYIAKILETKKPQLFVLENVRGLQSHDNGKTLQRILDILTVKLEYKVRVDVLNSHNFGVPQTRRRIYLIGTKNQGVYEEIKELEFQKEKTSQRYKTVWHLLEREVDDKYYLSKKILKTILSDGTGGYSSKSEINRLIARPLTATMHKLHRANQDNYYSDRFIFGNFSNIKQSVALAESTEGPGRIRRITPVEAFRLQGFPDEFVYKAKSAGVSDTQLYRQSGNAITVNVAETVLKSIFRKTSLLNSLFR
ncbi:MAG: DNA cytosine methyltransferase [bacterium]|nr:DNA cytosine methyltransferase [bacterium]